MKKNTTKLLISILMFCAATLASCKTYTHQAETQIRSALDSSIIAFSASSKQSNLMVDSAKFSRKDSSTIRQESTHARESEVHENFTTFVAPDGKVRTILKNRITKTKEYERINNTSSYFTEIKSLKAKLNLFSIERDSLRQVLKLSKAFAQDSKTKEKNEPPDYWLWVLIGGIVLIFCFWIFKTM